MACALLERLHGYHAQRDSCVVLSHFQGAISMNHSDLDHPAVPLQRSLVLRSSIARFDSQLMLCDLSSRAPSA